MVMSSKKNGQSSDSSRLRGGGAVMYCIPLMKKALSNARSCATVVLLYIEGTRSTTVK